MKRLFFGIEVTAPWPETYPPGRVLDESERHVTIAFLKEQPLEKVEEALPSFPTPHFACAPVGLSDKLLFLPPFKPRVVAHHIHWLSEQAEMDAFSKALKKWLSVHSFPIDERDHLPHVTIARAPFKEAEWEVAFEPLPFVGEAIALYESVGNLRYTPIWRKTLPLPFEEKEHTADIAFEVRGRSFEELYLHGAMALSFKYPPFASYIQKRALSTQAELVKQLNEMVFFCDRDLGCPFKAVSHHGKVSCENDFYTWEMIVDV